MNLREMAEAAGFWGWSGWAEELKQFAILVLDNQHPGHSLQIRADTSLTDEPPPSLPPTP